MVDYTENVRSVMIRSAILVGDKRHTMGNDGHVPDVGGLVHERTDLSRC